MEQIIRITSKINEDGCVENFWESTHMTRMQKGMLLLELEGVVEKLKTDWYDTDHVEHEENI